MKQERMNRRTFLGVGAAGLVAARSSFGKETPMQSSILILGGGFGGIAAARRLRAALPDRTTIRLIDRRTHFHIGATKTWVMLGEAEPARVDHPLQALTRHGIEVLTAEIQSIDAAKRSVATSKGTFEADYLIVALGAELNMASIPGLATAAETFYTMDGAVRLRERLKAFQGGRLVMLIPRAPFKCPPGPYEATMLLHAYLEERGLRERTDLEVRTVEKRPMATAGPTIGQLIVSELEKRGVGFFPETMVATVEAEGGDATAAGEAAGPARPGKIVLEGGEEVSYDLLIAIPPHEAPGSVVASGLAGKAGWIPVDPLTLRCTLGNESGRIYAVGDVTAVPLPGRFVPDVALSLPKAGVFAERQAVAAAAQIAGHILGQESKETFDGTGYCYIEMGEHVAMRGDGDFFALPHPTMTPTEASAQLYGEKKKWVEEWVQQHL